MPSAPDRLGHHSALMQRCAKRVSPGVFEVYRQGDSRLRGFFYSLLAVLLFVIATSPAGPEIVWKNIRLTFATERVVEEAWAGYVARRMPEASAGQGTSDRDTLARQALTQAPDLGVTYEEFRERMIGNAWGSGAFVAGAVFALMPALLILIPLLIPQFCPVRVDGPRGLIYAWAGRRLWIYKFDVTDPGFFEQLRAEPTRNFGLRRDGAELSGLELTLDAADGSGRSRKFHLGVIPPNVLNQWVFIKDAVEATLRGKGLDPDWAKRSETAGFHWTDPFRKLLSFTLVKPSVRRSDQIEAQVREFLIAQNRGGPS